MSGFLTYGMSSGVLTPSRFRENERVRLSPALGGASVTVVRQVDRSADLWMVAIATDRGGTRQFIISGYMLERRRPFWKPGDVVLVRHHGKGPGYTYVRGTNSWPTEHGRTTDETISEWYSYGWVEPKLQAGAEPFDQSRF